ncbi:hypothetical protein IQ06DRAFT_289332 [Phaeosphaeriaceae sp. SRC1lsM3a]|nr:hypothetical protein IQ06DRAFT_289332 [Stagonospora sp. SRC1lsM3a]
MEPIAPLHPHAWFKRLCFHHHTNPGSVVAVLATFAPVVAVANSTMPKMTVSTRSGQEKAQAQATLVWKGHSSNSRNPSKGDEGSTGTSESKENKPGGEAILSRILKSISIKFGKGASNGSAPSS